MEDLKSTPIKEKMKISLDVNMVYGYFLSKYRELKKRQAFIEPKVIESLRENKEHFEYRISSAFKVEITRRLVTELNLNPEETETIWDSFLTHLKIIEFAEREIDWGFLYEIVKNTRIKKRLSNLIHVSIARSNDLWFLTGDKEMLTKVKKYYSKIVSYSEFRKLAEKYLNKKNENNNYEEIKIRRENGNSWWKKSKSKSTSGYIKQGRIREEGNGNNEESYKKGSWLVFLNIPLIVALLGLIFLLPTVQAASYWLDENGTSLTSGLVGYWKFSEGSGSIANDSSGYNNRGTLTNFDFNATSGWTDDFDSLRENLFKLENQLYSILLIGC